MVNYFSKFIPKFSEIAAPGEDKKGEKSSWGKYRKASLLLWRMASVSPRCFAWPILTEPSFFRWMLVRVRWARFCCRRSPKHCLWIPHAHSPVKKASSAYESEYLAVIFGVEKFCQYLEHREFILETDNHALSWLLSHPRQLGKLGRWIARLMSLKFEVWHIRGTSKIPCQTPCPGFLTLIALKTHLPCAPVFYPIFPSVFLTFTSYNEKMFPLLKS